MKTSRWKQRLWILPLLTVMMLFVTSASAEETSLTTLETTAKSAVLIEIETGKILLAYNENEALPMASTTKVITALMALEYGNLDELVTTGINAYGTPGTSIYLDLGEQLTLHDMLYGLMIASGNDAAVAIAEHIGGDVETFCAMANARVAELGCENTVLLNPNGLPEEGHQTTAYELALIAREAMSHDLFREIVSTTRASIPWEGRSYPRVLNNKNRLLTEYEGATGIKTGYTKAAGRCLVFGAKRDGMEVIGVVLYCNDWFEEAKMIMDTGFERYDYFTALGASETVRILPVDDAKVDTAYITIKETLSSPVPQGCIPSIVFDMPTELTAGMMMGDIVGKATLMLGEEVLDSSPLLLTENLYAQDYAFHLARLMDYWLCSSSLMIAQ